MILGVNCVSDSVDVKLYIKQLLNAKNSSLSQLTKYLKAERLYNENEKDQMDNLIEKIELDYSINKYKYILDVNFKLHQQMQLLEFKQDGNVLILLDKAMGIEYMRMTDLNKIGFNLLESSEYIHNMQYTEYAISEYLQSYLEISYKIYY